MDKFRQFIKDRALAAVAAAIVIVLLLLVVIIFILASSDSSERTVTIEDITGSAFILKDDGQVAANRRMRLESGDVLITAAHSTVKLETDKDKYIYVEPETTIYVMYTENEKKGSVIVNISEGAVVCRLDSKLSKNEAFEVRTPNAVVSAAGTVYRTSFSYFDEYAGYEKVKLTDVQCADGSVNIQLFDDFSSPVMELMALAEGKSARLMTCGDVVRYEYLNMDTDINTFGEDALKTLIRIAAEREIFYSLRELNDVYQKMLEESYQTETSISTMYPPADESFLEADVSVPLTTSVPTETISTEPTTETASLSSETEETTVTEETSAISETTAASLTSPAAISVTSPTSVIITVGNTVNDSSTALSSTAQTVSRTETSAPVTIPPIETAAPITTTVPPAETTPAVTSVPETSAEESMSETTSTAASFNNTSKTSKVTEPTIPWWEIINSSALTQ